MTTNVPHHSTGSWFDSLYDQAGREAGAVPWANLEPCAWVVEYLASNPSLGSAVVVGCGLGDDAEALAASGYATTAFDVSAHAIEWCRERFPETSVEYRVADLFDLPTNLVGRFDLVVEVRTIQSLPPSMRNEAINAVASLIAPGGVILVVALARPDGTIPNGPPWAVSPTEIGELEAAGLEVVADHSDSGHFALELSRNCGHE